MTDERLISIAEDLVRAAHRKIVRRRRRRDLALLLAVEVAASPIAGESWTIATIAASCAAFILFTYDPD